MSLKEVKEVLMLGKTKINYFILILITIVYLLLFFIPELKVFFRKFTESSQLKAEIIKTQKDWANIDAVEKKILQLNERIDYYEKRLPDEKEIPSVLEYLSEAAKRMDVRITEIKPVEQDKDEISQFTLYYKAPILLKAECGYHQLGRFLNRLESAARFMKINDLKIVANPRSSDIHYVQLTVITYVMRK